MIKLISRRFSRPRLFSGNIAVSLSIILTFLCSGIPARAGLLEELARRLANSVSSEPQKPSHLEGAPIPNGPDAVTNERSLGLFRAWCNRNMLDPYQKTENPDPRVAAFIQHRIDDWCSGPADYPWPDLDKEGDELEKSGAHDPLFLLLAGEEQRDQVRKAEMLKKAAEGFPQSSYPKFVQFLAAANVGAFRHRMHAAKEEVEACDNASLDLLRASLETDAFPDGEMAVMRMWIALHGGTDLFERHAREMCEIFDSSSHVQPWLAHYYEGARFIKEAWDSRGSGWANTVSREGWRDFAKNIAFAREHLVKSWELNPKDPAAAARMITVTMAESENKETMRMWFDRSAAAQMDYVFAYQKMLYGLYPRWLGSHEEMLQFAGECMRTNRYDTYVPYQYVNAVREVFSDGGGQPFKDPTVYKNIQDILANYIKVTKPGYRLRYYHTLAAIFAYKAGKLDEARQHMEAIDFKPDDAEDLSKFEKIPLMMEKLKAAQNPSAQN